jgi:8-oxo-dGTP pyrophosphatase MutT (NUDIX family)
MFQRYKVFFNDCLLSISTPEEAPPGISCETIHAADRTSMGEFLSRFESAGMRSYFLCSENPEILFATFLSFYHVIEAAGGIVRHSSGKYLFIKRFGKWDLPKGKIEPGETPEMAALREVNEECGISGHSIIQSLPSTYHTYKLEGTRVLKRTWWFSMEFSGDLAAKPQEEEGISEVAWLVPSRFDIVLENSYRSIAELIGDVNWTTR